jgi:hypothetical protein
MPATFARCSSARSLHEHSLVPIDQAKETPRASLTVDNRAAERGKRLRLTSTARVGRCRSGSKKGWRVRFEPDGAP